MQKYHWKRLQFCCRHWPDGLSCLFGGNILRVSWFFFAWYAEMRICGKWWRAWRKYDQYFFLWTAAASLICSILLIYLLSRINSRKESLIIGCNFMWFKTWREVAWNSGNPYHFHTKNPFLGKLVLQKVSEANIWLTHFELNVLERGMVRFTGACPKVLDHPIYKNYKVYIIRKITYLYLYL